MASVSLAMEAATNVMRKADFQERIRKNNEFLTQIIALAKPLAEAGDGGGAGGDQLALNDDGGGEGPAAAFDAAA